MSTLNGCNVVVTGKIAGETRQSAEAKLRLAGAHVQSSVTRDTQLLVTGEIVGATKINAARKAGAEVKPWDEVMGNGKRPRARIVGVETRLREARGQIAHMRQVAPMLCKGVDEAPEGWLYEVKWDGYRCIAVVASGGVTLWSRSGKPYSFPHIEDQLADLPDCILDGELVVLDENGNSDFAALGNGHSGARYVVFDVLEAMGQDVRSFPIEARKDLLTELVGAIDSDRDLTAVEQSPVFGDGSALIEYARGAGLEGIVAKKPGSTYHEGARGPAWVKIKLRLEQEFVVLGWTDGKNGNTGHLGALILGVQETGYLRFCGKVGTGFDDTEGDRLLAELRKIELDPPGPVLRALNVKGVPETKEYRTAHYVEPVVVVQVQFQRWTADGALWHPSYKGQRLDKEPSEVVRES